VNAEYALVIVAARNTAACVTRIAAAQK
jgi:hypothetical protein